MNNKGFPWWGWILMAAGVTAGALDLNWFMRFGWNVGAGAATEGIDFVEESSRPVRQLPVGDRSQ